MPDLRIYLSLRGEGVPLTISLAAGDQFHCDGVAYVLAQAVTLNAVLCTRCNSVVATIEDTLCRNCFTVAAQESRENRLRQEAAEQGRRREQEMVSEEILDTDFLDFHERLSAQQRALASRPSPPDIRQMSRRFRPVPDQSQVLEDPPPDPQVFRTEMKATKPAKKAKPYSPPAKSKAKLLGEDPFK